MPSSLDLSVELDNIRTRIPGWELSGKWSEFVVLEEVALGNASKYGFIIMTATGIVLRHHCSLQLECNAAYVVLSADAI